MAILINGILTPFKYKSLLHKYICLKRLPVTNVNVKWSLKSILFHVCLEIVKVLHRKMLRYH